MEHIQLNKNRLLFLLLALLCMNPLLVQALTDVCQNVYFAPDDLNREHPLAKPHPKLVKSLKLAKTGNVMEQMNMAVDYDKGYLHRHRMPER